VLDLDAKHTETYLQLARLIDGGALKSIAQRVCDSKGVKGKG
jgi:hypothetical protein